MDDVLQMLYRDDLEILDARNAGIDGKSSSALLSANGLVSSRALRARSGALYPPWRISVRLAPVCCRAGGEGGEGRGSSANAGPGWCWCRGVAAVCCLCRPWLSGGFILRGLNSGLDCHYGRGGWRGLTRRLRPILMLGEVSGVPLHIRACMHVQGATYCTRHIEVGVSPKRLTSSSTPLSHHHYPTLIPPLGRSSSWTSIRVSGATIAP